MGGVLQGGVAPRRIGFGDYKKPHRGIEPTVRFLDLLSGRGECGAWVSVDRERVDRERVGPDITTPPLASFWA